MPSRTRQIQLIGTTLLVLAFLPGLAAVAFAGGPPSPAGAAEENGEAADPGAAPEKSTGADRVYALNGVTISWDLENQRFRSPTSEEASALARQFREWTEAKLGEGPLPPTEEIVMEELPNGMLRARLPIHMMNAAMVSVGPQGELAGMCTEGAEGAAEALAAPAASSEEVRR